MKKRTSLQFLVVIALATAGIFFLSSFNSYLQPYIEREIVYVLIPVIVFALFMKLIGFGYTSSVNRRNTPLMVIHIIYQIRIVVLLLIFFAMMFNSLGKNDSLMNVMGEYFTDTTNEQILTVYQAEDEFIYDHKNRIYYLYNKDLELKEQHTYRIKYLETSRIIVDVQGPLNQGKFELQESVQIKEVEYNNDEVSIQWEPFYWNGEESKKYRVKSYMKREDGTLMRSGSQIVVEDKETSVTIDKIVKNKDYQFVVEPYFDGKFIDELKGTSEFITTK